MSEPVPFGKYLLLERVAVGGMAEVWKARLPGAQGFEKVVAIKRILPDVAEDADFVTMFADEAKIAVALNHSAIAQVYEYDRVGDSYFIAMEYVAGKDLRAIFDRLRKRRELLPIPLACHIVSRLAEGLDYAHRKTDASGRDLAIVHRDVSPQNVLVSWEGEVKLVDFGIAKAANKVSRTQAGVLKGKFAYMSPEQVRGLPLDRRSDVFALGVVLYELLTGERAFLAESDFATLERVRNVDVLPPRALQPRISAGLEQIVLKALARDVNERYAWAGELWQDLDRLGQGNEPVIQRDVARFLRSTFAEDLEREKVKAAEVLAPATPGPAAAGLPAIRRDLPPPAPVPPPALAAGEATPRPAAPSKVARPGGRVLAVAGAVILLLAGLLGIQWWQHRPAYLTVTPQPPSAEVLVDGKQVKPPGPGAAPQVELAPGAHHVRVRAEGYDERESVVPLGPGEHLPLELRLDAR